VVTSLPTPPGKEFGFVVEYYIQDKSKNAAPIARRLIRVVCPGTETHCIDPDTNAATCTVKGVCGAPQLLTVSSGSTVAAAASSKPSTASSKTGASTGNTGDSSSSELKSQSSGRQCFADPSQHKLCCAWSGARSMPVTCMTAVPMMHPFQRFVSEAWQQLMSRTATWSARCWCVEAGACVRSNMEATWISQSWNESDQPLTCRIYATILWQHGFAQFCLFSCYCRQGGGPQLVSGLCHCFWPVTSLELPRRIQPDLQCHQ